MRIGLIGGAGGQATRLLSYEFGKIIEEYILYDHHGEIESVSEFDKFTITKKLEELLSCSGIIIMSPNATHFFYIKFFVENNYKGYIYCEKPPVDNMEELDFLKKISLDIKEKIIFGFNLQRSLYKDILTGSFGLGNIQYCNIISGHGLGFKEGYSESWRNNPELLPQGIFGMVIIHYLELFIGKFGLPKKEEKYNAIRAPKGKIWDNCMYSATFGEEDMLLNVYASYTMPFMDQSIFVFDNGYIVVSENETSIYAPRECYDDSGNFKKPKRINVLNKGTSDIWKESLRENILYFFSVIQKKGKFNIEEYNNALLVNEYILKQ